MGYLPTINASATNMSTVHEGLVRSVKIKDTLQLKSIVVVLDQTLYAKATDIVWKYPDVFEGIVLTMGAFHTICTLSSIFGKRCQDAGLRDIFIESGVIAEGSVSGVLDGRRYNRAVRFHKLMYEALQRLAWKGFQSWIEEIPEKNLSVQQFSNGLIPLYNDLCQREFDAVMKSQPYSEFIVLYDRRLDYLGTSNGKLSSFWMSYLDIVEILLNLLRASREGDWELHLSATRKMIPWCFVHDNLNYARYLSAYFSEMSHVEEEHPVAFKYLRSGGFSVQIGEGNTFGKVPVDQAC